MFVFCHIIFLYLLEGAALNDAMIIVILHTIYRWVDPPNFFFAPVGLLPQKGKAVKKGHEYPHHHHHHWELSFTYLLVMLLREGDEPSSS